MAALPGWIKSIVVVYPPDRALSYAELLPLVLAALPETEPFIILGESFSGPLAAMVAAQQPLNLAGLILCASFVTAPIAVIGPVVRALAWPRVFRVLSPLKRFRGLVSGYSPGERRELFAEVHAIIQPAIMASRVQMIFRVDARESLRACAVPLLYIAGARDRIVPRRNIRIARSVQPGMKLAVLESTHYVLQSQPVEAAKVICEFAESLGLGVGLP